MVQAMLNRVVLVESSFKIWTESSKVEVEFESQFKFKFVLKVTQNPAALAHMICTPRFVTCAYSISFMSKQTVVAFGIRYNLEIILNGSV